MYVQGTEGTGLEKWREAWTGSGEGLLHLIPHFLEI